MPLFDLSERVKLRLRGEDRLRFLNGQVTNDVRKANLNLSLPACVLNARGRLEAFLYISAEPEALLVDAEPELSSSLQARLERYLIADEVAIADVSEELALFHLLRESPILPNDYGWRRSNRFGVIGWDLFAPASEHERLRQTLAAQEPFASAEAAEKFRIEQGVPRWGRELTPEIIPVEANLETEAIDYAKGCYIGQEVISRMKMSGQTNKRLSGLVSLSGAPLAPGSRLTTVGEEGKEVGWITSATYSDWLGEEIALGFVKRGYDFKSGGENQAVPQLEARPHPHLPGTATTPVKVVPLPFAGVRN